MFKVKIKPKVLISGCLPPPMGGVASFCQSLIRSSLSEKINLHFVQTSSQNRALSMSGRVDINNIIAGLKDCMRFTIETMRFRPQIAHIATTFGMSFIKHSVCVVIARLAGSKVIIHPHCSFSSIYFQRSASWRWFFRRVISLACGVIGLSREWLELRRYAPKCRTHMIHNGICLLPYQAIAAERSLEIEGSPKINILYLGYLGKDKGTLDLIEAAKQSIDQNLPAIFNLVGDELSPGEMEAISRKIVACKLENFIKVHPASFEKEKINYFREAQIFIYPSHHEGMPMAVIEAMASGLPIIATKVGGLPDLVEEDVNGILVAPQHPDQLAESIRKLVLNDTLRKEMGRRSHNAAISKYDIEKLVNLLVDLYEKEVVAS